MWLARASGSNERRNRSALAGRLLVAFGANLALFGIALVVLLHATSQLDAADAEVGRLDRAKDAAYRVAALVRDQYIHQAHTIIEGNRSHLNHYEDIARKTREALSALRAVGQSPEDVSHADAVAAIVQESDSLFHVATLSAVDAGDRARVRELHASTELVIYRALTANRDLTASFERRSELARARADRLRNGTRATALLCFGLSALLAVAVALATTRWIASRVTALREAARTIGAGDLTSRVALDGNDEFAEIAHAIDEMAADLARHQEELLRAHRLASIGQVAAGVAHEINNPLGVILGYVKTMRRSPTRDDEGLDVVEEEATQCKRIVEGLLDLARPEQLVIEELDIAALIAESRARLASAGKLMDRSVHGPKEARPLYLTADRGRLRQVLINVLTNAVEATPPGGRIEIGLERTDSLAVIEVRDSGAGFAEEVRARLFQPFVTTKRGGIGLGLAIAQAIVEAHRGRIVGEPASGGGAVLRITLPLSRNAQPGGADA